MPEFPQNSEQTRRRAWSAAAALPLLLLSGCMLGPRALEASHGRYNDAVKRVEEEQMLLNIVRLRYNESPMRLDVSSIATQYEVDATAEARPFFSTEAARIASPEIFAAFTKILPFAGVTAANRPTMTLVPLDDPDNLRGLFRPATLDGIIFLAETSYPVSTVYRLLIEYMNGLPNAVSTSGPPQAIVPEFEEFQHAAMLLQALQDRGAIRFAREEKITELSGALPAESVTSPALVEAAKNGLEYRPRDAKTWVLVRRDRQLVLRINPAEFDSPELTELYRLLHLKPRMTSYAVSVESAQEPFAGPNGAEKTTLNLFPRSVMQALFYISHGVEVPAEHQGCATVGGCDLHGATTGLFAVHSAKQCCRPKNAYVAIKHRGYWFYVDDCDANSKITFSLMMTISRVNLLSVRKNGPALTLPVGR